MTNKPQALENIVSPIELPAVSDVGYTLFLVDGETRITEDEETRITEDGETRILDGYDFTVTPVINVVEFEEIVHTIEVE